MATKNAHTVIGMTKDKATKHLESQGLRVRITSEEGNSFFGTADVRHDRANLTIEDGKVTKISFG